MIVICIGFLNLKSDINFLKRDTKFGREFFIVQINKIKIKYWDEI